MNIKEKGNTTVAISVGVDKILSKQCNQLKISKKEFLEKSIVYFQKQGISPIDQESPSIEMEKIRKRIDQLIAFQRSQEDKILKPACSTLVQKTNTIEQQLNRYQDIATNENLREGLLKVHELLNSNLKNTENTITTRLSNIDNGISKIESVLLELIQVIDLKNKSGLSDRMKGLFR